MSSIQIERVARTHGGLREALSALAVAPLLWAVLVVALLLWRDLAANPGLTAIGDPDDATRLLQVRAYMAGAGWYDMLLPRLGGETPLVSHWSRLIDVAIGGLIALFGVVTPWWPAEVAARAAWPALLTLLLLLLIAREAEHRAGRIAGLVAIVLAATTFSGMMQFRAGRIDHHNVMILATLAGLLWATRAPLSQSRAISAGAALGFALTIGYEPLAIIVPFMAIVALMALVAPAAARAARAIALGFTLTMAVGLVLATPPAVWNLVTCDAIAVNVVLAATAGTLGLAVLASEAVRERPLPFRFSVLAASGLAAIALYALADPTCLAGPFARVGAEAKAMWLANVAETRSIVATFRAAPLPATTFVLYVGLAFAGAIACVRRAPTYEAVARLVVLVLAIVPALFQSKFMPYASFLATFVLAISIASLGPLPSISAPIVRVAATLGVTQATLIALLLPLMPVARPAESAPLATAPCMAADALAPLAHLPPGLVVAEENIGPYIALFTPHDALAAPYHRIDRAIVEATKILAAPPAQAEARLKRTGASYVVMCVNGTTAALDQASLEHVLARGEAVTFLEPVVPKLGTRATGPLRVWRVK